MLALLCAVPVSGQDTQPANSSGSDARTAMRGGDYEGAEDTFRQLLREDATLWQARADFVELLTWTGRYELAEELARGAPDALPMANSLGEVLVLRGDLDGAEAAFRHAVDDGAPDALTAEVNLAELLFDRGQINDAMQRFDRFIDIYNNADGSLRASDLVAVGRAVHYLGRNESAMFGDALRAFDEAAGLDTSWSEPSVRAGDLFLEKYSSPEAKTEFEKALARNPRHPGALLGMAKALSFDNAPGASNVLTQILEINPNHVEARSIIAAQHLTREGIAEAKEEAETALAVNPQSLIALTALAASQLVAGELAAFQATRSRALDINPRYAALDTELAEISVQTRRYAQAVERAQAAVALDDAAWEAWGLLGMNQLRVGDIEEGRANIEKAFAGDPFNPWFKNTLDLLDTFERFEVLPTEHFELFLHGTEADLLATYLAPIAEEAYDSLARRYGVEPPLPVRAEFFPSHADFSVRTLGEAGLGALGVSFGSVLVMDSPAARAVGDYNWASVFWHELSHTFHLGMTDNRVPRWFSEGLAVHEQRQARSGWGHQPNIPFLQALRDGELKKVSELNDGFMRPDFPQQVIFSYYQASLVFQVLEEQYGFQAIRDMLEGYKNGATTPDLFQSVLGCSIEDFDNEFEGYLQERFRSPLQGLVELGETPDQSAGVEALQTFVRTHPGDLLGRIRLGVTLITEERWDEAESHLDEALRIFPDYSGPDSPLWWLAQVYRSRGDIEGAAASLDRLNSLSESNYNALTLQADLLEQLGRPAAAAAALDKAVLVWPYEVEVHERLANLHDNVGDYTGAVRERAAVVALKPTDMAEAYYLLALAHQRASDTPSARRAVLQALDIAPNYDAALELLLLLRSGNGAKS